MAGKEHLRPAPTRDAVARLARVSSATVSRAYNAPDSVAPEKVRRIQEAARRLGYVPDKHASALRRAGSGVILYAERRGTDGTSENRFYFWIYADIVRSIQRAVERTMYSLSLFTFDSASDVAALAARRPEGILLRNRHDEKIMKAFHGLGVPLIVCHQGDPVGGEHSLVIDERGGGRAAVDALVRGGCARPLHITGSLAKNRVCRDRWEGFRSGCGERNPLLIDGELGIRGGAESGREAAALVKAGKADGIFVVNDLTAVGVVQALLAAGLRIPEDVQVIGYDKLPFIETLPVELATIDIGFGKLYEEATGCLFELIRKGAPVRRTVLPRFVPGASVRGS